MNLILDGEDGFGNVVNSVPMARELEAAETARANPKAANAARTGALTHIPLGEALDTGLSAILRSALRPFGIR